MIKIKFKALKIAILSKKYIITFLTSVIFLTLFISTVSASDITDLAGREVELPEEIEKIVAVGPGALRLVVYLEAEKMVVGIEEFERRDQKNLIF